MLRWGQSQRDAALEKDWLNDAPVTIVIAAVYERTVRKYMQRAERYVHMKVRYRRSERPFAGGRARSRDRRGRRIR